MHDMRTTRVHIAGSVLKFDSATDVLLALEKVSQVWGRLVQPSPHLHVDPLERLVGLIAI